MSMLMITMIQLLVVSKLAVSHLGGCDQLIRMHLWMKFEIANFSKWILIILMSLLPVFDNTLRSLLYRHAPVKHKNTTSRPCVPWMNDEIKLAKRQRRKAERKWRAVQYRKIMIPNRK